MSELGPALRPIIFSPAMVRAILAGQKTQTRRLVSDAMCVWGSTGRWFWPAADFDQARKDPGVPDHSGAYSYGHLKVRAKPDHEAVRRLRNLARTTHRLYPRAQPGGVLWVREACWAEELDSGLDGVRFAADGAFVPIANTQEAGDLWGQLFHYRGRGKGRIGNAVPPIHMPRWACRLRLRVEAVRIERLQDITEEDARAEGAVAAGFVDENDVGCRSHREGFAHLWNELHGKGAWQENPWVVVLTFAPLPLATELGPPPEVRDAAA